MDETGNALSIGIIIALGMRRGRFTGAKHREYFAQWSCDLLSRGDKNKKTQITAREGLRAWGQARKNA